MANRRRTDRSFNIGDLVLLKLQPYRQQTLRTHKDQKLSPKFFGPYKVIDKVGKVAYRLDLPPEATVHPTFHVSQLKPYHGHHSDCISSIPATYMDEELEPEQILDRKMVKRGGTADTMVLIGWKNYPLSEAT